MLNSAIQEAGHIPELIQEVLPQLRANKYLDSGKLSLCWMIESEERNQRYIPINVGLTNGLIGKRILFIRRQDQKLYNNVNNLEDFRKLKLIGGMGKGWFDVKVWEANNLKYQEQSGNWKVIFNKIHLSRDFNYFSRGVNEILAEAKQYPMLGIENRLVLIYDRDVLCYLSKDGPKAGQKYKTILEVSLKKAKESGLIESLVKKYWGEDFKKLDYGSRVKIYLDTPK